MLDDTCTQRSADHHRTIIHLDADCFYAQVEMVRDPTLKDKPMGVKQKNLMVTSNYVARSLGVKKSMWIKEALEILPDLILVDGSDLTHYRQFSSEIHGVVQTFSPAVERLGLDENFVDVTDIVEDFVQDSNSGNVEGHVYGDKNQNKVFSGDPCGCGCRDRLTAGALVAKKLRQRILEVTGITCCAGVAHNKLAAKLVCGYYKPNQQTVVFPWLIPELMNSLSLAKSIPGIGSSTFQTLEEIGIYTVKDLQNSSLTLLHSKFDEETSKRLKDNSFGIDETPVRRSGRPQSIGLEDAFRKVNSLEVVRAKYFTLVERLIKLLQQDGRIPSTVRVSVRKFDTVKKFGRRESRQAPILPSVFASGVQNVKESTRTSLMDQTMELFHKMVDTSKEYHLTLLGIAFTKFVERATRENSISKFFLKRKRSVTENRGINEGTSEDPNHSHIHTNTLESSVESHSAPDDYARKLNSIMDLQDRLSDSHDYTRERKIFKTSRSNSSDDCNGKVVMNEETTGSGCDESGLDDSDDTSSPQKYCENTSSDKNSIAKAPHGIDQKVFEELPADIQNEILAYKQRPEDPKQKPKMMTASSKTSKIRTRTTLDNYFTMNPPATPTDSRGARDPNFEEITKVLGTENDARCTTSHSDSAVPGPETGIDGESDRVSGTSGRSSPTALEPPEGVDPAVFCVLPREIQLEIVEQWRHTAPQSTPSRASRAPSGTSRRRETSSSSSSSSSSSITKYFKKK